MEMGNNRNDVSVCKRARYEKLGEQKKAEDAYRHPHTLKIFLKEASWQSQLQ